MSDNNEPLSSDAAVSAEHERQMGLSRAYIKHLESEADCYWRAKNTSKACFYRGIADHIKLLDGQLTNALHDVNGLVAELGAARERQP